MLTQSSFSDQEYAAKGYITRCDRLLRESADRSGRAS